MASKPSILLLHGALGAQQQLKPLEKLISERFDVHRLNFTGHGGVSSDDLSFSIDLFAKDVVAYIEAQNLSGINVFGYSMGGYVALKVAQIKPALIGKIFTLATKFHWTPESAAQEVRMLNPAKIKEKVPKFAQALATRHHPENWEVVMQKTADMMLDLGNGKAFTPQELQTINHEILITVGTEDTMVSIPESEDASDQLPNATFTTFSDWQHPIEKVDMYLLSERLSQFIS